MKKNESVIAFYMRLSTEDMKFFEKRESNSIENQRKLLYDFTDGKGEFSSSSIIEKIDDGYTGTNFERPGFQELMNLVKRGEVNCIIVKDFSRFGRDYIELGNYLEQLFPLLGIRFISVNDRYDSLYFVEADGFEIGFKNLIYELYSRDLSVKVKKAIREKQKMGQYLSGFPLYGYQHAKEDRHRLAVDEESAGIVREIFQMRSVGMTFQNIARSLNDQEVPTPAEYAFLKYGRKKSTNTGGKCLWTNQTIHRILTEERYTGVMISHKHEAIGIQGTNRCVQRKDWIKVEGMHEAIIPKELFVHVQVKKNF